MKRWLRNWLLAEEVVQKYFFTNLWMILGLLTIPIWAFFLVPSLVVAVFTYCLCVYYGRKWKMDDPAMVMAALLWLGTLILWYQIYQVNETKLKLKLIAEIMES